MVMRKSIGFFIFIFFSENTKAARSRHCTYSIKYRYNSHVQILGGIYSTL